MAVAEGRWRWRRLGAVVAVVGGCLVVPLVPQPAQAAPGVIEGTVFRDWNQNGVQDSAAGVNIAEPGVGGIEVRAFDSAGTGAGPVTSTADGHYSISLAGLSDAVSSTFRVEFTIPAATSYLQPGPMPAAATSGAVRNGTSVQFSPATGAVTVGTAGVDFGVANPSDYCQANPLVVTPCFIGEVNGTLGTLKGFNYNRTGIQNLATQAEIGSTWGVAWDRTERRLLEAAFTKRHAPYAPGTGDDGPDQIFVTDPVLKTSSVFTTIEAGPDLHDPAGDFDLDLTVWDAVGRTGFGDIDLSEDDSVLYVVNMFDRTLYAVDMGAPTTRTTIAYPDPGTGADGCPLNPNTAAGSLNRNLVPGGLHVEDGVLYATLTCTAENVPGHPNPESLLRGFVYTFDGSTFTQVANFPLDYARDPRTPPKRIPDWKPWTSTPPNASVYPQPWLLDVEIDSHGFMIVGIGDRFGHQAGASINGVGPINGLSAGDILRLAPTGTTFTLESGGSVGGSTPVPDQLSDQGPGGGEYYFRDDRGSDNELTLGGLAHKTGTNEILTTVFDPILVWTGGVHYYRNVTTSPTEIGGDRTGRLQLFGQQPQTFGKAAGLGDLELLCDAAPVQIGNRVWLDLDLDGVQDPEEPPVPNVTVELLDGAGSVVSTTTTDAAGLYTFPVDQRTAYTLRFDTSTVTASDLPSGYPSAVLVFTVGDAGPNDAIDSDPPGGAATGSVAVPAHAAGHNDHTFDAGVVAGRQRLGNLVWADLNDNGVVDTGEPGIPGVTVQLYRDSDGNGTFDAAIDALASTTTTSATGAYFFPGLSPSTYFVAVPDGQAALAGMRSSTGASGGSVDNDDNGDPAGAHVSVSGPISLQLSAQPTGETDVSGADDESAADAATGDYPDTASNLTVDLGFFTPAVVPKDDGMKDDGKDDGKDKGGEKPRAGPSPPQAKQTGITISRGKLSISGTEVDNKLLLGGGLIAVGALFLLVERLRSRPDAVPEPAETTGPP